MLLMRSFDQHFVNVLDDNAISIDAKIRWLTIRARAHVTLKLSDGANECLGKLFALLRDNVTEASEEARQLGVWMLLMHGASAGNVEWANWAASNATFPEGIEEELPNPEVLVISSMISSESDDLLGHLDQLFSRLANGASHVG